jgi:hypothetical protein
VGVFLPFEKGCPASSVTIGRGLSHKTAEASRHGTRVEDEDEDSYHCSFEKVELSFVIGCSKAHPCFASLPLSTRVRGWCYQTMGLRPPGNGVRQHGYCLVICVWGEVLSALWGQGAVDGIRLFLRGLILAVAGWRWQMNHDACLGSFEVTHLLQ